MLQSLVPWVEGDDVMIVGGNMSGTVVQSRKLGNDSLEIDVSEKVLPRISMHGFSRLTSEDWRGVRVEVLMVVGM